MASSGDQTEDVVQTITSPINICLGAYDGAVAGLQLTAEPTDGKLVLEPSFTSASHASVVRAIALRAQTLVTAGADEIIRVYDLNRRVEESTLLLHEGTINSLRFAEDGRRSLLFSASDDGSVAIWRPGDWKLLKRLVGHHAPVMDIGIHPSAQVALTVSKDRSILLWNLEKSKIVFSAKTKNDYAKYADWSPSGDRYALVSGKSATVSFLEGRGVDTFSHDTYVTCAAFCSNTQLATACDDALVRIWDVRTTQHEVETFKHQGRVRNLSVVEDLIVSTDSIGLLSIWDRKMPASPRHDTCLSEKFRITALAAASQSHPRPTHASREDVAGSSTVQDVPVPSEKVELAGRRRKRNRDNRDNRVGQSGKKLNTTAAESSCGEETASQRKRKKRKFLRKAAHNRLQR